MKLCPGKESPGVGEGGGVVVVFRLVLGQFYQKKKGFIEHHNTFSKIVFLYLICFFFNPLRDGLVFLSSGGNY